MRVQMYFHIFNNLSEFLNKYLTAKIRRVILTYDLMDRECNCSHPYKVNGKCVYEVKYRKKCLIFKSCVTLFI